MTYTPIVDTIDLRGLVLELAVNRLANAALQGAGANYRDMVSGKYQGAIDRAHASAKKYRQIEKDFIRKAENYQRKLDAGESSNDTDYRIEVQAALSNAVFYRELSDREEENIFVPSGEATEIWQHAMNASAGQLGNRTQEKLETEAVAIYREILSDIKSRLEDAKRTAIENNRPYLDGTRVSMETYLRSVFGEHTYVADPELVHVDGRLDHINTASIYTNAPENVRGQLQARIELPEGALTLVSAEPIPLNDGSKTFIVEVKYAGSKRLHE